MNLDTAESLLALQDVLSKTTDERNCVSIQMSILEEFML